MIGVLMRQTEKETILSQRRRPRGGGGRDEGDAATRQGVPGVTRNWTRQEGLSLRLSEGA